MRVFALVHGQPRLKMGQNQGQLDFLYMIRPDMALTETQIRIAMPCSKPVKPWKGSKAPVEIAVSGAMVTGNNID